MFGRAILAVMSVFASPFLLSRCAFLHKMSAETRFCVLWNVGLENNVFCSQSSCLELNGSMSGHLTAIKGLLGWMREAL